MIESYQHAAALKARYDRQYQTDTGWDSMVLGLREKVAAQRVELAAERIGKFIRRIMK
jgi:hypothetical protein